MTPAELTKCVAPPGSGLRAFMSDTNGRRPISVVNVSALPPSNPWRCP